MNRFTLFAIVFSLMPALCAAQVTQGKELEPAPGDTITVGLPAPEFTFPSIAKLVYGTFNYSLGNQNWEGEPGCTVSLIHSVVILTAQHCIIDEYGALRPRISIRFRATERSSVQTYVVDLSNDNTFLKSGAFQVTDGRLKWQSRNDLALILLPGEVPDAETRVVKMACQIDLATFDSPLFAGWGLQLPQGAQGSRRLLYINGLTLTNNTTLDSAVIRFHQAARYRGQLVTAGACNGDSGGPLYLSQDGSPHGSLLLAGVMQAVSPRCGSATECAAPNNVSIVVGLIANEEFLSAGTYALAGQ